MSSTPIATAARLLRENAEELKQAHTLAGLGEWPACEGEVKAIYDEHIAVATALDAMPASEQAAWHAGLDEGRAQKSCLVQIQEPAVNQQLTTEQEPVAGHEWGTCSVEHVRWMLGTGRAKDGYEVRYLYAAPVLAAQPATNHSETPNSSTITVPRGWKLVPDDATPEWIANLESSPVWSEAVGECIKKFLAAAPSAPQAAPAAVAVPDAVRDALLQSEAALEVATARILKADPDHSISVTSEAKALVAVRAALAATPAATAQARGGELNQFLSAAKDAGITHLPMSFGEALRELEAATGTVVLPESDEQVKELMVLIGKYGSAVEANSTGNPSNYTLASDESAAYEAIKAKLRALLATGGQAQADKEMQLAMQEASSLAQSIFKRHYSDDEHYASGSVVWGLCDSLRGVISQIDNMTSGLVRAPQAQDVGRGEVLVTVSGFTGSGKSAIAGEIEILCRALGLQVDWPGGDSEKNMTHADWTAALEQYKPRVRIVECNVPHSVVKGQDK